MLWRQVVEEIVGLWDHLQELVAEANHMDKQELLVLWPESRN